MHYNNGIILCLYRGYNSIGAFIKITADALKFLEPAGFIFSEIKKFVKDFYFTRQVEAS